MSHFELTCSELGLSGQWETINPKINSAKVDDYIISWNSFKNEQA